MNIRKVLPYTLEQKLRVKPDESGLTVLELYQRKFPYIDTFMNEIESGLILNNGKKLKHTDVLSVNDRLIRLTPNYTEPDVPDEISIAFEDDDIVVAVKPAPMPVHPCGRFIKNSLKFILEERGYGNLHTTHRIDLLTQGLVVLAKNKKSAAIWSEAFGKGIVKKTYIAHVEGRFPETLTIDTPIRRREAYLFECHRDGKNAVTDFIKISELNDNGMATSIIECTPRTGRTHQIRLHLVDAGFPIVDDPYYNKRFGIRDVNINYTDHAISLFAYSYTLGSFNITSNKPGFAV